MNMKPIAIVMALMLASTALHARRVRNFQFSEFGYQWTTDSGNAPGPGTFSPSHVSPLSSGIGFTLTETDTGSIVGGEARTLDRFLYGTFQWTEYVPVQASGQVSAGFLYYSNSITEIDVEQTGDHPGTFWFTSWVGAATHTTTLSCCYDASVPHTITLIWKPGEVDYFVDGVLFSIHTQDVPSTAAYFIFNFWGTNSTDWGGVVTAGTRYYVVSDFSYSPNYY